MKSFVTDTFLLVSSINWGNMRIVKFSSDAITNHDKVSKVSSIKIIVSNNFLSAKSISDSSILALQI